MKELKDFISQFNTEISFNEKCVVKKRNRYYLLSRKLKEWIPEGFFYAGTYLGAIKGSSFFPSFFLLSMISKRKANKIVIDKKTAWLFICGRDIFRGGILYGNTMKKGDYTLILNKFNECLGFGRIMHKLNEDFQMNEVVLKNILDIGDFLRREKSKSIQKKPCHRMQPYRRRVSK